MKCVDASITIEYSLLLPVLFFMYVFFIYIGVYQYNFCLLQNDVRCIAMGKEKPGYQDKYLLVEELEIFYIKKGGKTYLTGVGEMVSPLFRLGIGKEEWFFESQVEVKLQSPVNVLTTFKEIFDA